jgi:Ricin-type beta-trefoil lectin domain
MNKRKLAGLLLAATLAIPTGLAMAGSAQAASPAEPTAGTVRPAGIGAAAVNAGQAQAVSFAPFRNYGNRKCVDVATENATQVQLWNCTGGAEQQWQTDWVDGANLNLQLTNQWTGGCLGVEGGATSAQARVVSAACGQPSTIWHNNYAFNDTRPNHAWHQQLKNVNSGLCLDLQFNNSANGTPIWLWPCTTGNVSQMEANTAQLWMLP